MGKILGTRDYKVIKKISECAIKAIGTDPDKWNEIHTHVKNKLLEAEHLVEECIVIYGAVGETGHLSDLLRIIDTFSIQKSVPK